MHFRYRIVKGDNGGNFSVDSVTGEIRPNGLIDYELINPTASSLEGSLSAVS